MERGAGARTRARQAVLALSAGLATLGGLLVFFAPERLYREYATLPACLRAPHRQASARYGPGMEALVYWA